ncbi:MAG: hypothetical protein ACRDKG_16565, partial [Actinomycetota bacterium]
LHPARPSTQLVRRELVRGNGRARVWLLPNPSGLNAHHQLPELAAAFRRLRVAAGLPSMRSR